MNLIYSILSSKIAPSSIIIIIAEVAIIGVLGFLLFQQIRFNKRQNENKNNIKAATKKKDEAINDESGDKK